MAHKILIVDDERINMALVKFGLSEQRYQVVEAKDGIEGIEKVKEEKSENNVFWGSILQ